MKKKLVFFGAAMLLASLMIVVNSCNKDEDEFNLSTIMVDDQDMNGVSSPVNVALDPTINVTFSSDVDQATATSSTITLTDNIDASNVAITITVAGKNITIVPNDVLGTGSQYDLKFLAGIKGSNGVALDPFTRSFVTEGVFAPAGAVAYWNFNETPDEQINGTVPSGIVNLTYGDSYSTKAGKAGYFDGTTTIVEFANGDAFVNTEDFTLSFWVKTKSAGHINAEGNPKGHFVMGLGAAMGFQFEIFGGYDGCKLAASYNIGNTATQTQDLWFNGAGEYNGNGGWKGWTYCRLLTPTPAEGMQALIKDQWAHIVCVYDAPTKIGIMYINGERMKEQDFNLYDPPLTGATGLKWSGTAPDVVNELAFGFIQSRAGIMWDTEPWGGYDFPTSNHFGGWLDDVRIYHKSLTADEISQMYDSAK